MFQISRESDYAIRVMVFMAARPSEVVSCKEISKTQHIPRSFLHKILQRLLRAGLLHGWRGARGGFQLAVDPARRLSWSWWESLREILV